MSLSIVWDATCAITFINSIKGYGYGLKGWELQNVTHSAKNDILEMMNDSFARIRNTDNFKSVGYSAIGFIILILSGSKIVDVLKIHIKGVSGNLIGTRIFRLAKYVLFSTSIAILKSATDRNRLQGTTFIQINFMMTVGFASWLGTKYELPFRNPVFKHFYFSTFTHFNITLGFLVSEAGRLTLLGALMGTFSVFSGFLAITSLLEKNKKREG